MSNFSVCPFCPSGSKDEMLFFTQSRRSKLMIIVVVPSEIKIEVFFIQRRPSKGCEIMQRFHGFTYWCWKLDKPVKVSRWLPSVWSVFEQLFATSSCTSVTDWFWWLVYRWSWSICANTRQEEQWSGGGDADRASSRWFTSPGNSTRSPPHPQSVTRVNLSGPAWHAGGQCTCQVHKNMCSPQHPPLTPTEEKKKIIK